MSDYYTGVGSRKVISYLEQMERIESIGEYLSKKGLFLRSGGAEGSDMAFENGHNKVEKVMSEIFLPWKGFNSKFRKANPKADIIVYDKQILYFAKQIISTVHPKPFLLTESTWKLHIRNVFQVLGKDLNTPSRLLVCWTESGKDEGGTKTAITIARMENIPVFNINSPIYNKNNEKLLQDIDNELEGFF